MGRDTHYRFGNMPLDRVSEKVHRQKDSATPLRTMKTSPGKMRFDGTTDKAIPLKMRDKEAKLKTKFPVKQLL